MVTKTVKDGVVQQKDILNDYYICVKSREISIHIRKDVLGGKAKFGVFDDGKELFQVALAKVFNKGDYRVDYYRGHTLLLALEIASVEDIFAQLYADAENDPFSGGRQMNGHHATPFINEKGDWMNQQDMYNMTSDTSPTAGQMARGFGLAYASKTYRNHSGIEAEKFSNNGNEVCFCNIGDGSTSEGIFWEVVNAAGVEQIPLVITVADDGYAISVQKEKQTTKASISKALAGFDKKRGTNGLTIEHVNGWDYKVLCAIYKKVVDLSRKKHIPALIHVDELTQQLGHSTSGSHERYKSKERLAWEREYDCNVQFRKWILAEGYATEEELLELEQKAAAEVEGSRKKAWNNYYTPIKNTAKILKDLLNDVINANPTKVEKIKVLLNELQAEQYPAYSYLIKIMRQVLLLCRRENIPHKERMQAFVDMMNERMQNRYSKHLYDEGQYAATKVDEVAVQYRASSKEVAGYLLLNQYFDQLFASRSDVVAFGEDVGFIGDVNQGFAGLQKKYGANRIFDTGIREWSIIGQGMGMAMRGLRPISEIQYLDYLIYAYSVLSDDLATLRYRTNNKQIAPQIIRTRGHRLEGIWHSGSPMSVLLSGLRGIYILVPRNMTQAAGMYNTLLQAQDPAIVIEPLNAYRLKERVPSNLSEFTVPLGKVEVLERGSDVTIVTYGSCVRIAQAGIELLAEEGISVELIDVQSLMPFDTAHEIIASLKKTNRILFLDEDVPGGASAFMMQEVLEKQKGYMYLDAAPVTLTAKEHRPAYADDGNYYSKPSPEDVFDVVFEIINEAEPYRFV